MRQPTGSGNKYTWEQELAQKWLKLESFVALITVDFCLKSQKGETEKSHGTIPEPHNFGPTKQSTGNTFQ